MPLRIRGRKFEISTIQWVWTRLRNRLRECGLYFRDITEWLARMCPMFQSVGSSGPGKGIHHEEWFPGGTTKWTHRGTAECIQCSLHGCSASYCICRRKLSCDWHYSDTTNRYNTVTSRKVPNQIPCSVHSLNHWSLLRQSQIRALSWTEWTSVVFSYKSRFCLGATDGHVLVGSSTVERLKPNCLRPWHTGTTPGVMVWGSNLLRQKEHARDCPVHSDCR